MCPLNLRRHCCKAWALWLCTGLHQADLLSTGFCLTSFPSPLWARPRCGHHPYLVQIWPNLIVLQVVVHVLFAHIIRMSYLSLQVLPSSLSEQSTALIEPLRQTGPKPSGWCRSRRSWLACRPNESSRWAHLGCSFCSCLYPRILLPKHSPWPERSCLEAPDAVLA